MAARPQPVIRANGLVLRPWQRSDRPVVVSAYADPAIRRWHCRSMSDDEAETWIAHWPGRWRGETGAGWAVLDTGLILDTGLVLDTGRIEVGAWPVSGQFSLRRIDLAEGLAEVSYWVLPGARGRRVASRALSAVTAWSFATLGLHRVEVSHSTANVASCRVAEQAGFAAEGTKRGEALHADGWHDMHLHARLASDA
jgi:RimJ/RimL family protein N-acetyltransferase